MTIAIHRATAADWQRLKAVRLRALADAPDAFWTLLSQDEQRPDEQWQADLAAEGRLSLIGVHEGEDAGMAWGGPHHATEGLAGLYGMWVAPAARGSGLAELLVRTVIDWSRDAGYDQLVFDVNDDNIAAQRLYARCGAVPTGRRDTFPPPREHITEHELVINLSGCDAQPGSAS